MIEVPETHYVETPEGVYLAYQTFGEGSLDFLLPLPGGVALDLAWDEPVPACVSWRLSAG